MSSDDDSTIESRIKEEKNKTNITEAYKKKLYQSSDISDTELLNKMEEKHDSHDKILQENKYGKVYVDNDLNQQPAPPTLTPQNNLHECDNEMNDEKDRAIYTLNQFIKENGYIKLEEITKINAFKCNCLIKNNSDKVMVIRCVEIPNLNEEKRIEYLKYCKKLEEKMFSFFVIYGYNDIVDNCLITIEENYMFNLCDLVKNNNVNIYKYFSEIIVIMKIMHNSGFIHCNLFPDQIFINSSGSVVLGNYGQQLLGNKNYYTYDINEIQYISPEILDGKRYDDKADIWSMACLLYFIETRGETPFDGKDINDVINNMKNKNYRKFRDERFNNLFNKCFSINPNDRYSSVKFQKKCYELYDMQSEMYIESIFEICESEKSNILDFSNHQLSIENIELITLELNNTRNLEILNLSKTDINDISLLCLCNHFKFITFLKELNLEWNYITDEGVNTICEYITSLKALDYLNISRNYIHDVGASTLFRIIKYTAITKIHLKRNYIHDESIKILADNILQNLEVLNLSSINILSFY